jgi:indolepyruvate ferredoxin oxidoreductase beta subunit
MNTGNALPEDPFNIIITGVGGQGNVLASRMLGNILSRQGHQVTIGETFGASQRGGSVMSHLRVSVSTRSPLIPKGRAHLVISLEPTETLRVLSEYGNPDVRVLCNTRPIHSISVLSGEQKYPSLAEIKKWVTQLSAEAWFIDASAMALELGNPIYGNIIMMGALAATGVLPLDRQSFGTVIAETLSPEKVDVNLTAYDRGAEMIQTGNA